MNYAQLIFDTAVDKAFDYEIPPDLRGRLQPGHLVEAPFRTATQPGIVLALSEATTVPQLKTITRLIEPQPVLSEPQLALARWLSEQYIAPIGMCAWMLLPPLVRSQTARPKKVTTAALAILPDALDAAVRKLEKPSKPADLLELIARTPERLTEDAARKQTGATAKQVEKLVSEGWLVRHDDDTLTTPLWDDDLREVLMDLRGMATPGRVLRLLAREKAAMDVSWIYAQADADREDLKKLADAGLIVLGEDEIVRDSLAKRSFVLATAPTLTDEQAAAWSRVRAAIDAGAAQTFLLFGVTGSGKTEIYLRAIEATLARGRDAIFLVPEIALTAQTVRRVAARFPGQVAVVHSGLSDGERYDTWRRARAGAVKVVIGARSALFTPLPDVGLIVLDEEHDQSYKQSGEQHPPHYHARATAEELARLNNAVVILGSATPAIETLFRAERGEIARLDLPSRIFGHRAGIHEQEASAGVRTRYHDAPAPDALTIDLPPVEVVDMRAELKSGNSSIFSRALQQGLQDVLLRREQALLLMNRRGQATYVFCRDCGYVATCPNCDAPLTHHRDGEALRCHRCGYMQRPPSVCPACASKRIKYFGAGTQQVEESVKAMFPEAQVLRWDADSARTPGAHEAILQHFIDRFADIIVGTQMIAKGLDLPMVTLVGVISADISLNLPDFRAAERGFQLLTQVAGRAGRGVLGGKVILQTYQPEHYAIRAAAAHDTAGFYTREIAYRRELGYPPFRRLARVICAYPNEAKARAEAERAAGILRRRVRERQLTATELIGPAPCFFARSNHDYRWHVLLRSPDPTAALRGLDLPSGWHIEIDPLNVL
jgi:primosomal protein N' (replication factor Y)